MEIYSNNITFREYIISYLNNDIDDGKLCEIYWKHIWPEVRDGGKCVKDSSIAKDLFWVFEAYSPDFPNIQNNVPFEINKDKFKSELKKYIFDNCQL